MKKPQVFFKYHYDLVCYGDGPSSLNIYILFNFLLAFKYIFIFKFLILFQNNFEIEHHNSELAETFRSEVKLKQCLR